MKTTEPEASSQTAAMSDVIKAEMKEFIDRTSLKGAPRIMKSPNSFVRVFWIVAVVMLLGATAYFVTYLILEYLKFNTVITVSEYSIQNPSDRSSLQRKYEFGFPAVTFCNQQPFKSNYDDILPPHIVTHDQFVERLAEQLADIDDNVSSSVISDMTAFSYLSYIGTFASVDEYYELGQSYDDLFVSCSFLSVRDDVEVSTDCTAISTPYRTIISDSTSCQTLQIDIHNDAIELDEVVGISAVLYLDNFAQYLPESVFDLGSDFGQNVGIKVLTHLRDSYPQIFDVNTQVSPRENAKIDVTVTAREALSAPYGDCVEEGRRLYSLLAGPHSYSREGCVMACRQEYIVSQCNCFYGPYYLTFHQRAYYEYGIPLCHVYDLMNADVTVAMVDCALQVSTRYRQKCYEDCKQNCTELQFTHEHSSTRWPAKSTQLAFYNSHIRQGDAGDVGNTTEAERRHANFAPVYEPIREAWLADNKSAALEMLRSSSLIEDNFVKVELLFSSKPVVAFESKEALSGISFLSLLGGTLNLYAGITFVLLFEVVELLVKLCENGYKRYKERRQNQIRPFVLKQSQLVE